MLWFYSESWTLARAMPCLALLLCVAMFGCSKVTRSRYGRRRHVSINNIVVEVNDDTAKKGTFKCKDLHETHGKGFAQSGLSFAYSWIPGISLWSSRSFDFRFVLALKCRWCEARKVTFQSECHAEACVLMRLTHTYLHTCIYLLVTRSHTHKHTPTPCPHYYRHDVRHLRARKPNPATSPAAEARPRTFNLRQRRLRNRRGGNRTRPRTALLTKLVLVAPT